MKLSNIKMLTDHLETKIIAYSRCQLTANLAAVVSDLSRRKLPIHAGYGHIAEQNFGVPVLRQILKNLLHTNPFTVN